MLQHFAHRAQLQRLHKLPLTFVEDGRKVLSKMYINTFKRQTTNTLVGLFVDCRAILLNLQYCLPDSRKTFQILSSWIRLLFVFLKNHSIELPILKYALASIVHHSDYLYETLPQSHIIFQHHLFRNQGLLLQLKSIVFCGLQTEWDEIQPSGIPPDVSILKSIQSVPAEVADCWKNAQYFYTTLYPKYFGRTVQ